MSVATNTAGDLLKKTPGFDATDGDVPTSDDISSVKVIRFYHTVQ